MCTVTFLPKGKRNYILTSNRDETPKRAALPPEAYALGNTTVYFPKDPLAGGTWIVTDKKQYTLCLLNGGFEKHKHRPPYRLSRGQMVLNFFSYADVTSFINQFDFDGIEPFTLVIVENSEDLNLHQLVWNGEVLDVKELNATESYIWSSSTLYPQPVRDERASWFKIWLENHDAFEQRAIMEFHKSGGKGDKWNDFVMDRNGEVMTISVTSIESSESGYHMIYQDLIKEKDTLGASF